MITPEMAEHAKRLIAATNRAITEYIDSGKARESNEALNVADLSCRQVRFCIDDGGDWWLEVVIEEAGNCPVFCAFITDRLQADGFGPVSCATEWWP